MIHTLICYYHNPQRMIQLAVPPEMHALFFKVLPAHALVCLFLKIFQSNPFYFTFPPAHTHTHTHTQAPIMAKTIVSMMYLPFGMVFVFYELIVECHSVVFGVWLDISLGNCTLFQHQFCHFCGLLASSITWVRVSHSRHWHNSNEVKPNIRRSEDFI